jgi:hypothetical protein
LYGRALNDRDATGARLDVADQALDEHQLRVSLE